MKRILNLALALLLPSLPWSAPASDINRPQGPSVCVASLVGDNTLEEQIARSAEYYLSEGRGLPREDALPYVLRVGGAEALRDCLAGPYESVVLVSHSSRITDRIAVLVEIIDSGKKPVLGKDLADLRVSNSLKRFTLVSCFAESVLKTYPSLMTRLERQGIEISLAPASPSLEKLSGRLDVRSANAAGSAIAREALGPTFQENFK